MISKATLAKTGVAFLFRVVLWLVVVVSMVGMSVPPVPVFLLFIRFALREITMVAVGFALPLHVERCFVTVPVVVIAAVGIVDPMHRASGSCQRHHKGES